MFLFNNPGAIRIFYHPRQGARCGYITQSEIFPDVSCENLVKSSSTVIAVH